MQTHNSFCSFKISVSVRREEDVIFQYTRDFPFYFNPDNLDSIQANGVAIEDSFPIIPGHYQLIVLLQNAVGKEFSILEQNVFVEEDTGEPDIIGPVVGYYFNTDKTRVEAKGAVYPYVQAFFNYGQEKFDSGAGDITWDLMQFGGEGGVVIMLSNAVGVEASVRFSADSWSPEVGDSFSGTSIMAGFGITSFIY